MQIHLYENEEDDSCDETIVASSVKSFRPGDYNFKID